MARIDPNKLALEERVVQINRVAKVVKGGRRFSFSAVVVVGGIHDILAKVYGSTNPVNVTQATIEALRSLHSAEEISARRGVKVSSHIAGQPVAAAEASNGR